MRAERKKQQWPIITTVIISLMLLIFVASPGFSQENRLPPPNETTIDNCLTTISLLKKQKKSNSREFRQIKRELGLIKETISKPGLTEILGGIGYILGLFGISYYWYARNLLAKRQ